MYFDEFKHQLPDIDPSETEDWMQSLDQVVEQAGETRARFLVYKLLKRGKGKAHPTASSTVEVHYTGWTREGRMFDTSLRRGKPVSFPLGSVIKGWTEGVQLLVVGDRARFWIPGALAYGDKPTSSGPPSGPLVFDVELVSIK